MVSVCGFCVVSYIHVCPSCVISFFWEFGAHTLDEIVGMHDDDIQQLVRQYLPGVMFVAHGKSSSHARRVGRGIEAIRHHGTEAELPRFVS